MSLYPMKLVSPDGGEAMVNDAKDEATLRSLGFVPEIGMLSKAPDVEVAEEEAKPKRGRPKKED